MGQYYYIVNTKKRQYLHGHKFGDGIKLLEFGSSGTGTMLGLAVLLADGNGRGGGDLRSQNPIVGSWAGDPIVIAGDYADDGSHVPPEDIVAYQTAAGADPEMVKYFKDKGKQITGVIPNLYNVASTCYTDISDDVILALCDDPYTRKALIERGAEAAKNWQPPAPKVDPFALE